MPEVDDTARGRLITLTIVAAIGGALTGLVTGAFRLALQWSFEIRDSLVAWAHEEPALRWIVPMIAIAMSVAVARLIVRWVPESAGSGIQRLEASERRDDVPDPLAVLPAKFVGGILSMGAGLALGLEGPSVQMGAVIGDHAGAVARLSAHDRQDLAAGLGGAGLGVAFSAPLAGAVFVFEEITRAVRTRLVITTLVGAATALLVARWIVGRAPIFPVPEIAPGPWWALGLFALLGILLGGLGAIYNRLILWSMGAFNRIPHLAPEVKAGIVGAGVGLLAMFAPATIGGGETITETVLLGRYTLVMIALVLVARWILGPLSFSLGVAGGIFAPLLAVGALGGALLAGCVNAVAPEAHLSLTAFAIVGMSTFFTGVIRAPITGVILIIEMTVTTTLIIPMLLAAALAMITATLMRSTPIYVALRERLEAQLNGNGYRNGE